MSLRVLIGLLVAAALLMVPVATSALLWWLPRPDVTVRFPPCGADQPPGKPCIPHADGNEPGPPPPPPGAEHGPGPRPGPNLLPLVGGLQGRMLSLGGREMSEIRRHFLLVNLLSFALVVGLTVLLASLILRRPFRAVLAAIGDIEKGAAPPRWAFSGPVEFRRLGTALERLGNQLRANLQERDLMLAGLSHDLRSPLARIQAALEIRVADGERWDDSLRDVEEINHIVGQFIDFARDGQDEPFSLTSLDAIVRAALGSSPSAGLTVILEAPTPLRLRAAAMRRALRNLVDNARAHGVEPVTVRTWIRDGRACLRVEDAGQGIDAAEWQRLLQPFARGSVERSRGGAGLGLAIVQRIATMHGGELRMSPRDGEQPFAMELCIPCQPAASDAD